MTSKQAERRQATGKHVRILFYEDSPDDAELMLRHLRRSGYRPDAHRVDTRDDLHSALSEGGWQVAIVDYMVPGFPGKAALKMLAAEAPDVPVIVASGHAPEEVVAATIRLGAVDYLLKDDLTRVTPAVEHALAEQRTRLERSAALAALRENEARFRALFDDAPVALCELDVARCREPLKVLAAGSGDLLEHLSHHPDVARDIAAKAHIVRVNEAAVRLFEAKGEKQLRDESERIWAGGFPDAMPELLLGVANSQPVIGLESRAETVSGRSLCLLLHVDFLGPENSGEYDQRTVLMSMTDVTERKVAEQELRETRDRLQSLMNATNAIIYTDTLDNPGVTTFISGNVERVLGHSGPAWLDDAAYFDERVHPEDQTALFAATDAVLSSGESSVEYRFRHADGTYRWIHDEMRLALDQTGAPLAVVGQLWDITGRKAEEDAAHEAERQMALRSRVADAFLTESGEDVFDAVLQIVREEMESAYGLFGYLDEDDTLVVPRPSSRSGRESRTPAAEARCPRSDWGETLWAAALSAECTQVREIPCTVPTGETPVERAVACPLVYGGRVVGLFVMADKDAPYTDAELRVLEDVAAYTAPILHEWLQRTRFEAALSDHQDQLTLRNRIANVFLTCPGDEMYAEVLEVVLEALDSTQGIFYYLDGDEIVAPSLTRTVWDECGMADKSMRFPLAQGETSAQAILERRTVVHNSARRVPQGHVPIERLMAAPIIHGEEPIGAFFVANKYVDYADQDVALLEDIAAWVAPVLDARLHRQRAEEAERQAVRNTQLALAGGELGMYHAYPQEGRFEIDERYLAMLGYLPGEVDVGTDAWTRLIHSGDRRRVIRALEKLAGGNGTAFELEYRMRHKDDSWRWILDRGTVVARTADGLPLQVSGTHLDITERKDAEQAIAAGAERLRHTVHGAVAAMGSVVERRDPYTAGHERHVAELAVLIGRELGLSEEDLETLELAAAVHDIGKIGVPAEILARPGRLADVEMDLVRLHPEVGHGILASVDFQGPVAETVLQHHERLDGSGYPRGLRGDDILPGARIIAVADVVEAMASHRPYRPALGIEAALDEIRENGGRLYDAEVVAACERVVREGGFTFS